MRRQRQAHTTKHAENVTLLLGLLEETEFYIRWNTVQLLTVLLDNKPKQLQSSIMTSPLGVSRLIDLLEDEREVIRNGEYGIKLEAIVRLTIS